MFFLKKVEKGLMYIYSQNRGNDFFFFVLSPGQYKGERDLNLRAKNRNPRKKGVMAVFYEFFLNQTEVISSIESCHHSTLEFFIKLTSKEKVFAKKACQILFLFLLNA